MRNAAIAAANGLSNALRHTLPGQTNDVDPEIVAPA
jgi:hypothetical protein